MESKKIIIPIVLFLFLSISFLIYRSEHMPEPKWWSIYFVNAKDASLNFTIENHTENSDFHWQILADKDKMIEGDMQVSKDEIKDVIINNIQTDKKKITVEVMQSNEKKDIYKNY